MGNAKNKKRQAERKARVGKAFNSSLSTQRRNARSQLGKNGKFEKKIVRADPFHDSKGLCDVNDLHVDEKAICSLCDREAECQHDEQTMSWYCVECLEGHNIHQEWWESDNDNEDEDGSDPVECDYFNDHMHPDRMAAWNRVRAELMANVITLKLKPAARQGGFVLASNPAGLKKDDPKWLKKEKG